VSALADDMLKLYYEDFVARWDGFLHDVTLAPLSDLPPPPKTSRIFLAPIRR
jgi:type VI secretion system protein ImpL